MTGPEDIQQTGVVRLEEVVLQVDGLGVVPQTPVGGAGSGAASETHPGPHHAGRTAQQGLKAGFSLQLIVYSLWFKV